MFLELKNVEGKLLPACHEEFVAIPLEAHQDAAYRQLACKLTVEPWQGETQIYSK